MGNPLDATLKWYRTALDGLRVAERVLRLQTPGVITDKHVFFTQQPTEAMAALEVAKDDLARLAILDLAAVFERNLRLYVLKSLVQHYSTAGAFHDSVRAQLKVDVTYWGYSDPLLGIFPGVDEDLRGQVKQIVRFRDWIAHAKRVEPDPDDIQPENVTPEVAYDRLTAFLQAAGIVSP